jgi:dienelactone hydrolase
MRRAVNGFVMSVLACPVLARADDDTDAASSAARNRSEVASVPASRPADDLETEKVSFVTQDNIVIHGGYTAAPRRGAVKAPIAILLHMYRHERSIFDPLVPHLHRAGFAVLAIDLRGHGESVGPPEMGLADRVASRDPRLFQSMDRDVEAAYLWLAGQPGVDLARFVLIGASVGCSVALDYAVSDRSVDAVICLTPGTNYLGINSSADVRKYGERPLLLIASEPERTAAEELGRLATGATVRIVPGELEDRMALHGTRMFGRVAGIEKQITEFADKAVGPPPKEPVVASINSDVYHDPDSGIAARITESNRRWFSSAAEARKRGLRPPKSRSSSRTREGDKDEAFPAGPGGG